MTLTPEQKTAVAGWISAGDNLSVVQKKLAETFKISLTYRDVRFLVDDLDLTLKDAAPKVDTNDVSKSAPPAAKPAAAPAAEKKGFFDKAKEKLGLGGSTEAAGDLPPGDDGELPPGEEFDDLPGAGNVTIEVDKLSLIPGAVASGSVTFSDGVTGKWIVDQYGRPGFTQVSQPGYRPSAADAQSFMQELGRALQRQGY